MVAIKGTNNSDAASFFQSTESADEIFGFGGSDTINGLGGNDTIYGDVGSETTTSPSVDKIIGHGKPNTYEEYKVTNPKDDIDDLIPYLRKDFFGDSKITITARGFNSSVDVPYNSSTPISSLSDGSSFASQYGIGVAGGFTGQLSRQGSPIVNELGYNPNTGKSESISISLNGDFATEAWVNLGKFYDSGYLYNGIKYGHDYGTEVGLVKAFLKGDQVALYAYTDGDYTNIQSTGLDGVKFSANNSALSEDGKRHGNEDIGFGSIHITGKFDRLEFSALPYLHGSTTAEYEGMSTKPDGSDYFIQGVKFVGVTSSSGGGTVTEPKGPFNDIIDGGAGNDVIYGNAGSDTINGNFGADKIFGDNGDDTRNGGVFDDSSKLTGDVISGDDGSDTIYGEGYHDTISGGNGSDLIYGDFGNDKYSPSSWSINSYLSGNLPKFTAANVVGKPTGNDYLVGGSGRDTIYGENGNDTIEGGAGDDRLFGGAGRDVFLFKSAQMGRDVIHDFVSGEDKIDLSHSGIKVGDINRYDLDGKHNPDDVINWCDVPVFNGNMVITTEPLALYNNYILILGTTELKVSDFIFDV